MWPFSRSIEPAPVTAEERVSLENPAISLADPRAFEGLFGFSASSAGVSVTPDAALKVPAVWCAVNFISGTIASLPLILYRKGADGIRTRAENDPLYKILHDQVNDDFLTSFQWRKQLMVSTLLQGRSFSFIERNKAGRVMNLWLLDTRNVTIARFGGRRVYRYTENGKTTDFSPSEIIDIPYMVGPDGVSTISPVDKLRDAIGLALALENYAAKFFQNGGVPPLSLEGPMGSPAANKRASNDITQAMKEATAEQRNVLTMPTGYSLKPIGFNPEQSQLTEGRLFQLQEVARVYDIPPVFLQDLSRGTFSNTEQQDLHFVKHTLTQWLECIEQELNAKLFKPSNRTNFVEFSVDGLLRGDFTTRMAGYATGIQNSILTPDEVRAQENRPAQGGNAGKLFIQGATVPIETFNAANSNDPATPQPADNGQDVDPAIDETGSDDE